jgi:hypothetical protein
MNKQKHQLFASLLIAFIVASLSQKATAQTCSGLSKGTKMSVEVLTYPLIHDKVGTEFFTMKGKKKAEKAAEYSSDLNSGKVQPASTYALDYVVTDISADGEYESSTTIAGQTYKSYLACKDGNLYISRVKGISYSIYKGDTLGFGTLGVQVVPQNIKAGDLTPGYVDESFLTYNTADIRKTNFAIGNADYNPFSGSTTTSTKTGYVQAKVNYSVKGKILTIYQSGEVFGEEDMVISGKTYKCFKVRTEIWTKNDTKAETTYELGQWFADPAFNKQIHSQMQTNIDRASLKVKANMDDMAGTNKAGYLVKYKEEWIAPDFGVLQAKNYDQWGCLTTLTRVKALN